ncbi:hypothetical protein SEA_BENCZKOWSKI14_98 [Gordonia phage Benczkowski14]|uniref:Uncharacterized protein n=2 Tax=Demosthenesvirus katyusha TaxID=1982108 RepID=A0A142KCH5_9CAUD|nr:hypothetical protein FDH67_gp97 [Gordonia phage Katyusha]AMS03489.1 hypothetical protein SEA_KATYUSHA_96 [Gordonia phage Katyusha]AMS03808.1 hypothetical protein SEA_BENCZKOWSKI14_98 [Gordonia phage Benczkowski14]
MRTIYSGSTCPESIARCIEALEEFIEIVHDSSLDADKAELGSYRLNVDVTSMSRWVSVEVWRSSSSLEYEVACVALDVQELHYATRVPYLATQAAKIYTKVLEDTLRLARKA